MSSLLDPHSKHRKKDDHESILEKGEQHGHHHGRSIKKKVILAFLALFVLALIAILLFLLPSTHHKDNTQTIEQMTLTDGVGSSEADYQAINGADISTNTTETNIPEKNYSERIEVPGDVADKLLEAQVKDQIIQGEKYNTDLSKLKSKSRRTYVSHSDSSKPTLKIKAKQTKTEKKLKFKELPLHEIIENNHYTIQLTGASTKKNLLKYIREHKIENYQIYETNRKDNIWYVVVKGDYPTYYDAKSALDALPNKLKNNSPWVRSGKSLRKSKH